MSPQTPTAFDHAGYQKLTESLRKAGLRDREKAILGYCTEVRLFEACGADLVRLRGALAELTDLLAEPQFFDMALQRGLADTAWYQPAPPDTSVEGLLVSLRDEAIAAVAALLDEYGFRCISADNARPLVYVGQGNLAAFKRCIGSTDTVLRYDPPGGVVVGRAPGGSVDRTSKAIGSDTQTQPAPPRIATTPAASPANNTVTPVDAPMRQTEDHDAEEGEGYRIADLSRPTGQAALLTTPADVLENLIEAIVSVEGPMDQDLVARRVRTAYNQTSIRKSGQKVLTQVIAGLVEAGRLDADEAGFLTMPRVAVTARDRTGITDDLVRATCHLPPAEVRAAIADVLRDQPSLPRPELVVAAAGRLGFRIAGPRAADGPLGELIASQIEVMTDSGGLANRDEAERLGDDRAHDEDEMPRAA